MMTSLHECSWTGPSSGIVFLGGEVEWDKQPISYFCPPTESDGSITCEIKIKLPSPSFKLKQITLCSQSRIAEVYDEADDYITTIKSYYIEQEKEEAVLFRGVAQMPNNKICKSISIKLLSLFRRDKVAIKTIMIEGEIMSKDEVLANNQATERNNEQNMQGILGMLAGMQNRQSSMMNIPMHTISNNILIKLLIIVIFIFDCLLHALPRQPSLQAPPHLFNPSHPSHPSSSSSSSSSLSLLEQRLDLMESKLEKRLMEMEEKLNRIERMDVKLSKLERMMELSLTKMDKIIHFHSISSSLPSSSLSSSPAQNVEIQSDKKEEVINKEERVEKKEDRIFEKQEEEKEQISHIEESEKKESKKEENKEDSKEEENKEEKNKEQSIEENKEESKEKKNEESKEERKEENKEENKPEMEVKAEREQGNEEKEGETRSDVKKEPNSKEGEAINQKDDNIKKEELEDTNNNDNNDSSGDNNINNDNNNNNEQPEHMKRLQQMLQMMQGQPQHLPSNNQFNQLLQNLSSPPSSPSFPSFPSSFAPQQQPQHLQRLNEVMNMFQSKSQTFDD